MHVLEHEPWHQTSIPRLATVHIGATPWLGSPSE
jgi:hypothetical protein